MRVVWNDRLVCAWPTSLARTYGTLFLFPFTSAILSSFEQLAHIARLSNSMGTVQFMTTLAVLVLLSPSQQNQSTRPTSDEPMLMSPKCGFPLRGRRTRGNKTLT
ncbi:hypothetical protein COMA2_100078 [Candidatus Nitrospira nitrificans]|uniref:Uncharacterized protein n=1 Tax=Candidatus Nitrospira nitrificans TaxID=1742973 RepID=A0A0S4L6E7_9BACT|nr:hypothetical protein COMA2_100078 [Candidatus Nitrospira nitrificans]